MLELLWRSCYRGVCDDVEQECPSLGGCPLNGCGLLACAPQSPGCWDMFSLLSMAIDVGGLYQHRVSCALRTHEHSTGEIPVRYFSQSGNAIPWVRGSP